MKREFQVLYQHTMDNNGISRMGEVKTLLTTSEGEDQVRGFMRQAGFFVVAVTEVRAVVDWTKPNLDRDEAAAYFGINGGTFSKNKGGGKIPWSKVGAGLVPRAWLDKYIYDQANGAGKKAADELKKAA